MSKLIINNDISLKYPVVCDSYANMNNALDIWIKFSNYLTDEELLFMQKIKR